MTARRYTQAQVERVFADAAASAAKYGTTDWADYMLGYVSQSLGVQIDRYTEAVIL